MRFMPILVMLLLLPACLKTRSELRGDNSSAGLRGDSDKRSVAGEVDQRQSAQIDSRFFEINKDFRQLYGKIETLEKKIADLGETTATPQSAPLAEVDSVKMKKLEKRVATLEEALLSLDKKISQLKPNKRTAAVINNNPKGPFGRGELYYSRGQFEKAIGSYDEYRKKFPRGRRYAQATLKMGLSFQKLKMNKDAKAFYKEVIQRYPKTRVALRAQANLKSL